MPQTGVTASARPLSRCELRVFSFQRGLPGAEMICAISRKSRRSVLTGDRRAYETREVTIPPRRGVAEVLRGERLVLVTGGARRPVLVAIGVMAVPRAVAEDARRSRVMPAVPALVVLHWSVSFRGSCRSIFRGQCLPDRAHWATAPLSGGGRGAGFPVFATVRPSSLDGMGCAAPTERLPACPAPGREGGKSRPGAVASGANMVRRVKVQMVPLSSSKCRLAKCRPAFPDQTAGLRR